MTIVCDVILGTRLEFIMADSENVGQKEKKRGGRYCVAGTPNQQSCQNSNKTPGIRMHQFPANPAVRVKWVQFVRRHRHDFKDPTSKYTSLCSAHFEESCYERKMSLVSGIGLQMRYFLKKTAVPTRDGVNPPTPDVITDRMKRQVSELVLVLINLTISLNEM